MDLKNIKDQIKDIELDFDQNEVWQNIEKEQNNGKRKLLFWLFSVLGSVLLIVLVFHFTNDKLDDNVNRVASTNNISSAVAKDSDLSISEASIKNNNTTVVYDRENVKLKEEIINADASNIDSKSQLGREIDGKESQVQISVENDEAFQKVSINLSSSTSNNLDVSRNTSISHPGSVDNYINATRDQIKVDSKDSSKSTFVDSENKDENLSNSSISESVNSNWIVQREELNFDKMPSLMYPERLEYQREQLEAIHSLFDYNSITAMQPLSSKSVSIKFIFEYGILQRDLTANSSDEPNLELENRLSSESAMDHVVTGVHISLPIYRNLNISTGLEYYRYNDKLEFTDKEIRPLTQDDLPQGAVGAYGFVVSSTNSVYFNHLNHLNIPIELEANWTQNRMREFVAAGISFNLASSGRQLYVNEFSELNDNAAFIRSGYISSYVFKAGFGYQLSSNIEWSINASFRYSPSVLSQDSEYSQSYQSYLIGTGFAYRF